MRFSRSIGLWLGLCLGLSWVVGATLTAPPATVQGNAPQTLHLTGQGVTLYYLVPAARVHKLLPDGVTPYPGNNTIWFRVDFIEWTAITAEGGTGEQLKTFNQLSYFLEAQRGSVRVLIPLRFYADADWAVRWWRRFEKFPAATLTQADVNFSPMMHFFQFKREAAALAVIDAKPTQAMGSQMTGLFNRRLDKELWGGAQQVLVPVPGRTLPTLTQSAEVRSESVQTLLLAEPVRWKLLSAEEAQYPQKVLLTESLQTTWSAKP